MRSFAAILVVRDEEVFAGFLEHFPAGRYSLLFAVDDAETVECLESGEAFLVVIDPEGVAPGLARALRKSRTGGSAVLGLSHAGAGPIVPDLADWIVPRESGVDEVAAAAREILEERRRWPRAAIQLPLKLGGVGGATATIVSARSLFVPTARSLKIGEVVQVELEVESPAPLACAGTVVRLGRGDSGSRGVVIVVPEEAADTRDYLDRLVRDALRIEHELHGTVVAAPAGVEPPPVSPGPTPASAAPAAGEDAGGGRADGAADETAVDVNALHVDDRAESTPLVDELKTEIWLLKDEVVRHQARLAAALASAAKDREQVEKERGALEARMKELETSLEREQRRARERAAQPRPVAPAAAAPPAPPAATGEAARPAALHDRLHQLRHRITGSGPVVAPAPAPASAPALPAAAAAPVSPSSMDAGRALDLEVADLFSSSGPVPATASLAPAALAPAALQPAAAAPLAPTLPALPAAVPVGPGVFSAPAAPADAPPVTPYDAPPAPPLAPEAFMAPYSAPAVSALATAPASASAEGASAPLLTPSGNVNFGTSVDASEWVPRSRPWPLIVLGAAAVLVLLASIVVAMRVLRSPSAGEEVAHAAPVPRSGTPVTPARAAGVDAGVAVAAARPADAGPRVAAAGVDAARTGPVAAAAEALADAGAAAAPAPADAGATRAVAAGVAEAALSPEAKRKQRQEQREGYLRRGYELIERRDYARARDVLTRALKMSDDAAVRDLLALSHRRANEPWPAAHHLEKAAARSSGAARARRYVSLGALYAQLGKRGEACQAFRAAVAAVPGHAAARQQADAYCPKGSRPPGPPAGGTKASPAAGPARSTPPARP